MKSLMQKTRGLALAPLLFAAFGAVAAGHGGHDHGAAGVMVHDAWVRAVPPTSRMSAAYMRLENGGAMADRLVGVSSPIANVSEIHNVTAKDGMMQMFKVDGIEVPANGSVELKPGGYHVMLIDLKQPPKEGEQVEVTLRFEKGGEKTLSMPVRTGAMKPMGGMGHGHHH